MNQEIKKESYKDEHMKLRSFIKTHPSLLGCYVYALVDPTTQGRQVFYVGKGQNERMFSHIYEAFSKTDIDNEENIGKKLERIQKIHNAGQKVEMYILHYGLTNEHALIVESVLIDVFSNFKEIDMGAFGELANGMRGFDSNKGFCSIDSLIYQSKASKEIKVLPSEKILAIKISGTETNKYDILERTRKYWKVNPNRANNATYIAACRNGVVIGLYINKSGWIKVEDSNSKVNGRFYFEGEPVTDSSVLNRYLNHYIEFPRGARYPIMYIGGWK